MSQATAGIPASTPSTLGGLGVALIRGRIRSVRRSKRDGRPVFLTVITLPAADAYSKPAVVEVASVDRLGDVDGDVQCKVQIGGFPRTYEKSDEDEQGYRTKTTVQTADNTLTVLA